MRTALALRRDDTWTRRVTRMVGVSTAAHLCVFAAVALFGAWLATRRPPSTVAYSVELTDLPGTGGRLPGGPGNNLIGRSAMPGARPSAPPPSPAAPPAVKPAEPAPPPKPAPAPEPVAKVAPKVEPKKIEAKKVEPKPVEAKKVEKPKAPPPKAAEPTPVAKTAKTPPPAAATPAAEAKPAASGAAAKPQAATDDYAKAAERFRDRMAVAGTGAGAPGEGVAGGGPGGGVLGSGGDGRGGGHVKSLEWIAYRQRILNTVRERWSNAIKRPGLLTTVRFRIARDGAISAIRVVRASGNEVYDQTAVAAVERVTQLPPPPPAYADEFSEFEINFNGDEEGGVT